MPIANLLTLIDDISTVLDDVALMTKVATKKTAGVLGDDLALNAQQVTGVNADRELPVVLAVAVGSLKNKGILVPAALVISFLAPWAVIPLLMAGGIFLCYEGFEKIVHKFMHNDEEDNAPNAIDESPIDMISLEKMKVQGAIRTDFVLSAEIITITLGTVATAPFGTQVSVLIGISLIMTIGVYGLVAGIVKLDDGGLYLSRQEGNNIFSKTLRGLGKFILITAPYMMKGLSIIGTAAMFLVGGGILTHAIPGFHEVIHNIGHHYNTIPLFGMIFPTLIDGLVGLIAGAITLAFIIAIKRIKSKNIRQVDEEK